MRVSFNVFRLEACKAGILLPNCKTQTLYAGRYAFRQRLTLDDLPYFLNRGQAAGHHKAWRRIVGGAGIRFDK